MMKQVYTLLLLVLPILISAQSNYKEAYYITNNNDTVYGLINFASDKTNNRECKYKPEKDAKVQVFHPGDILGYRFVNEGLFYKTKEFTLHDVHQNLFLQYMVDGIVSLYYFSDSDNLSYFLFEDEKGENILITKKRDKLTDDGYVPDIEYRNILKNSFMSNVSDTSLIDDLKFSQQSMIDFTKKYHEEVCTTGELCITYEEKNTDRSYAKFKISAYTGLSFNKYKLKVLDKNIEQTSPVLGAILEVSEPRLSQSFSVLLDLSVTRIEGNVKKSNYSDNINYKSTIGSFRMGVRYRYPKFKLQPTAELGFIYSKMFEGKIKGLSAHYGVIEYPDYEIRTGFVGIYGGIGVDYNINKDSFLFLRFTAESYGKRDSNELNEEDMLNMPQLKLGYTF
ncbi:hypothetical protein D0T53_00040 [Dysgonomonas sp. 216]|uniref:hypothetical protein n=1 Tax=Dysgonomonas sp. 216 TaxID=2302934 RepID=UPI0013D504D3|nr:hypothetical protein [Dysgonomonas sp. 216]NDW17302.1 hypothetical protein [Dysgonomonas sp. 216]